MAETVGFGKLEREMLSNERLPPDVRIALVEFKQRIRSSVGLVVFQNSERGLPAAAAGQTYYEHQVGAAHTGDAQPRGKRRLVALVDAGRNILKIYFSDAHYAIGCWVQLQYP